MEEGLTFTSLKLKLQIDKKVDRVIGLAENSGHWLKILKVQARDFYLGKDREGTQTRQDPNSNPFHSTYNSRDLVCSLPNGTGDTEVNETPSLCL